MHDVVIIGGGPGGYAAALYAHNFGLDVALVEKERLGGTCLLRGCIPAKSWLHTAEVFSTVKRSAEFGVLSDEPKVDWASALARKNGVVDGLVKGLTGLLNSRKVAVIDGFGRLNDGRGGGGSAGRHGATARSGPRHPGDGIGAKQHPRLRRSMAG